MTKKNIEKTCEKILKKFPKQIKSILINADSLDIIIEDKKTEIQKYVKKIDKNIRVFLIENFIGSLFDQKNQNYNKIRNSEILYDPEKFIDPIKEVLSEGLIIGTKEATFQKFRAIGEHFEKIEFIKKKVMVNIYDSVIDSSQALLLEKFDVMCTQKEVSANIKKYLVANEHISKKHYQEISNIIKTFKELDHKKKKFISGKEIDKFQLQAQRYIERIVEELGKK